MRKLLSIKSFILFLGCLFLSVTCYADSVSLQDTLYADKTKIVSQQVDLLKNRVLQSKNEINKLQNELDQKQSELTLEHVNKQSLDKAGLDIAVAKSNLDSVGIELAESQQTITRLEKDTQEIENQFNDYTIFGIKIVHNDGVNLHNLQEELGYEKNLLELEKKRSEYLEQLQNLSNTALQYYKNEYSHIDSILKSQTIMQLKDRQAKSELGFQQQQSYWLQQLNSLYAELNRLDAKKQTNTPTYAKLENEIFYANENVSFTYLQTLIARYEDQIQQLKISVARTSSINLLNKVSDQVQLLGKQLDRVHELLKDRISILERRKDFLLQSKESGQEYVFGLTSLDTQYKDAVTSVLSLDQQLKAFRATLDKTLQQELSSRQGLPGFGARAWIDLGSEMLLVPSLTFQVLKSLTFNMLNAIHEIKTSWWMIIAAAELVWITGISFFGYFLRRIAEGMPDHEFGHVNLKWLLIKTARRNLLAIAAIANLVWLFYFCGIPSQNFNFLINLALVWLFFKVLLVVARLCLVETVHDRAGHDVRLYHRLKWSFIVGGVVTACTVFMHQLPLIFEVKDLFDRLFLAFLSVVSIFLLRSWEVLPGLVLPHIDEKHTYVKRVVRMMGFLIPVILLVNSVIGLFGFVNFVLTISWYEGIFLCVLLGYLFVRGLFSDAMHFASEVLISHVTNGWLWTEAFLKPIDKIFRMMLFLSAWVTLFAFYGWDKQSPVVVAITKTLHYPMFDLFNTTITLLSLLELTATIYVLCWAARWTREFVYRLLLSRTRDLGVRNSIAILSQYTVILVGIFVCLRVLGIDFRALTFVASAFALGVGLGLRDLVNNFACGFLLLFERPLRVGDTVTINDYEGEVTHIGGRAVTIRTWDHMEVLVPNAEIYSKIFLNWTAKDYIVRTVIDIKINRHDRPQDVQSVIHQVLAAHKDVLNDPIPEVFLKELNDGMTEFEVRYYINLRQVKSRVGVRSEVLVAIWEKFEEHGIQPPYPHHEIFLKAGQLPLSVPE